MKRLDGKVALVTGGARGIGRATALLFAREGAKVVVADRDEAGAKTTAAAIKSEDGEALAVGVDVTNKADVERMVAAALERFGRIDVLVNNAGILKDASLLKMEEPQWDALIAVNLKGVYLVGQTVARAMVERKIGGVILNASSIVGLYGNFGQTNYVAAKAGVIGMTRVWSRELGRKGIRVNAVTPGFIRTDMTAGMPPDVLEAQKQHTPLGRLGEAEDVAKLYLFLASDDASYISGQIIGCDGGLVVGT
jgi:3-oxoacyl-[acyl-carrier protein] reductase